MAYKHIKQQYDVIKEQYQDLLSELTELTKEAEEGLIDPDVLEEVKKLLEPLKINYERWTYIMFLLHKPNRDKKSSKYERQIEPLKNKLSKFNSIEQTILENSTAIEGVHQCTNS